MAPLRPEGRQKGEGIAVVHPDTGYTEHPELMDGDRYLIDPGISRNFLQGTGYMLRPELRPAVDNLTGSSASHGTKTASVLMSAEDFPDETLFPDYSAEKAIWGVAPKVELIPFRVAKSVVLSVLSSVALGKSLFYIVDKLDSNLVGVVSISLGGKDITLINKGKTLIEHALRIARKKGIIVCAAAGQMQTDNELGDLLASHFSPAFPGIDSNTICVAGCKVNKNYPEDNSEHYPPIHSGFLGPEVVVTAAAYDLWVARAAEGDPNPTYSVERSWGTSYATAIVAGACALWQAFHGRQWLLDPSNYGPELIFPLFKEVLKRTAFKPSGWDASNRGFGVLDAKKLLEEPLPTKSEIEALNNGT